MTDINDIVLEISNVITDVNVEELEDSRDLITKDRNLFVIGAGRNGLQGRSFAMRLMHIGYTSYFVGETITPAIIEDDVLIAISGSGNTKSILAICEKANNVGAKVISLTSEPDSAIAKLSEQVIHVPAATRNSKDKSSIQLLSTLFDQSVHIILDYLALIIAERDGIGNDFAKNMHSNLE